MYCDDVDEDDDDAVVVVVVVVVSSDEGFAFEDAKKPERDCCVFAFLELCDLEVEVVGRFDMIGGRMRRVDVDLLNAIVFCARMSSVMEKRRRTGICFGVIGAPAVGLCRLQVENKRNDE